MPIPAGYCDTGERFTIQASGTITINYGPCGPDADVTSQQVFASAWVTPAPQIEIKHRINGTTGLVEVFADKPWAPLDPSKVIIDTVSQSYRGVVNADYSVTAGPFYLLANSCGTLHWWASPDTLVCYYIEGQGACRAMYSGWTQMVNGIGATSFQGSRANMPGGCDESKPFLRISHTDNLGKLAAQADATSCGSHVCVRKDGTNLKWWVQSPTSGPEVRSWQAGNMTAEAAAWCQARICVLDSCDNTPIPGATVEIYDQCNPLTGNMGGGAYLLSSGVTGSDGCVTLPYKGMYAVFSVYKQCYQSVGGSGFGSVGACSCAGNDGSSRPGLTAFLHPMLRVGSGCSGLKPCVCPDGTTWNEQCQICQPECGPCQTWVQSHCRCETMDTSCDGGRIFSWDDCECHCPEGSILCNDYCIYEPSKPPCYEELNGRWNGTTCNWEVDDPVLPLCGEERACTWRENLCQWCCIFHDGNPQNTGCPSGYTWDAEKKDCVIPEPGKGCPPGYTWSEDADDCISVTTAEKLCPVGFWDSNRGQCVTSGSPGSKLCGSTGSWDNTCGQCTYPMPCPEDHVYDISTCECVLDCPDGEEVCNGVCIQRPEQPPCFSERNCHWSTTECKWVCDDATCEPNHYYDWDECECSPVDKKSKYSGNIDTCFSFDMTKLHWFRSGVSPDTKLYVDTFHLDVSQPGNWVLESTAEIIDKGASPSIIKWGRDGFMSLAYLDLDSGNAMSQLWDPLNGARNMVTVAGGAKWVDHKMDKWGRTVFAVYTGDWSVCIGKLGGDGKLVISAGPVLMQDKDGNGMNGAESQGSLLPLPDGGMLFTFTDKSGNSKQVHCRMLNDDGSGEWN
jgi:hypothetical protein